MLENIYYLKWMITYSGLATKENIFLLKLYAFAPIPPLLTIYFSTLWVEYGSMRALIRTGLRDEAEFFFWLLRKKLWLGYQTFCSYKLLILYFNVIFMPYSYTFLVDRRPELLDYLNWHINDYRFFVESIIDFCGHGSPGAIIFLPLLNAVGCALFGRYIGWRGASVLSIYASLTTCIWTFKLFILDTRSMHYSLKPSNSVIYDTIFLPNPYSMWLLPSSTVPGDFVTPSSHTMVLGRWIVSDIFEVNWSFLFDSLAVTMLCVVTTVSFLVHLYSTSYMREDPHLTRFLSYLSLFTFFMLILISADNFLQLFLGWEGVGLCSYLLISFWHMRIQANKAAIKAMLINRIGDYTVLLGIIFIYFTFKSVDYATVFVLVPFFLEKKIFLFIFTFKIIDVICFLLFIGAMGKSAQIGLHTWLPDAMEGPTPVSALIHAATMVTAGIFLIIRCSPIFEYSPAILNTITVVGGLTAFFAATIGLVQNDIKKIIAYSTCSQLGYMAFACGTSNYAVSLFHLSNHAFFKALLFLGAGAIIHSLENEQDIRKMGSLIQVMPFTYVMMFIGSLSLAGFPFLSGFYSKDVILELAFAKYTVDGLFTFWLGTLTAMFTAVYSFRLIFLVFINKTSGYKEVMKKVHELPLELGFPLAVLCIGSIFSGYMTKDLFIGFGSNFFSTSIFVLPENLLIVDAEFIPTYIKLLPTVCSFAGICGALFFYEPLETYLVHISLNFPLAQKFHHFLIHKWYFDHIQNSLIAFPTLKASSKIFFWLIDNSYLELFGPTSIVETSIRWSYSVKKMQTGYIYQYSCLLLFYFVFTVSVTNLLVKG